VIGSESIDSNNLVSEKRYVGEREPRFGR